MKKTPAKKLPKLKKRPSPRWFLQDWGTYQNQTIVVVGMTQKQIVSLMRRRKFDKVAIDAFEADDEIPKFFCEENKGGVWHHDGKTVMWLREWKDDWDHHETIVHECFHLVVEILGRQKNMGFSHEEALAYQQEYLWRNIRRKLQGYQKA